MSGRQGWRQVRGMSPAIHAAYEAWREAQSAIRAIERRDAGEADGLAARLRAAIRRELDAVESPEVQGVRERRSHLAIAPARNAGAREESLTRASKVQPLPSWRVGGGR